MSSQLIQPEARPRLLFQSLVKDLEKDLNHFDPGVRGVALGKLLSLRIPFETVRDAVNLHTHTFFSYHADGWSPCRYAWEARKAGFFAAGIIDFDGVDGVWEFLSAAEALGLRATAGVEVRGFLPQFSDAEIDSPGEPGVHYMAGSGFVKRPAAGSPQEAFLLRLRFISEKRSRELVERINACLPDIAIDWRAVIDERTPAGYGSERHFVAAYIEQARRRFPNQPRCAEFWGETLKLSKAAALVQMQDPIGFAEKVRARLMKRGGLGYTQPGPESFPPAGEVYGWMRDCGAVPMDSWLDGTSQGEARGRELLECNRNLGARGLNLIPDRNWNLADPEEKRRKLDNLARIVALASSWHMPLHIGTEGNRHGLPFVDNLDGPELAPFKGRFLEGARVLIGHALLARFGEFPYAGAASDAEFAGNGRARNAFFASVGDLAPLDAAAARSLTEMGPVAALETMRRSGRSGTWTGLE